MRKTLSDFFAVAFFLTATSCFGQTGANGPVDLLNYFLQKDDLAENWILGGFDVRPALDPDGTKVNTWTMTKFGNGDCYEVFKATAKQIQNRYEVFRPYGTSGKESWIRRFEAIDGEGAAPGAVWCLRKVTPGGEGFLSRWKQDRFVFDMATHAYVFDSSGSGEMKGWVSVVWSTNDWGRNNQTGFELNPVLRRIDEWQSEGLIFESYDYAYRKGLVAWRWYERVPTLRPQEGDTSGKIFHCEEGFVFVADKGAPGKPAIVFRYDPHSGKKGEQLEVISFTSHWQAEAGPAWYVIYRNSVRESALVKESGRSEADFALPEWQGPEKGTIKRLGFVHTHPAQKN